MKQILIQLDDDIAAKLEEVAPARTRRRFEFIRRAIRSALWELEEQSTADAFQAARTAGWIAGKALAATRT